MSSAREPFDPFLSKLSVAAEGKPRPPIDEIKNHIKKDTKDCIDEAKTALNSTKKWEECIKDEFAKLTRTVDEFLGDDQSTTSNKYEELLAIVKRVGADALKVSHGLQSSPTTSTPSSPSEDALKEATNKYEDLLTIANRVGEDASKVSHSFRSLPTTSKPSSPSEDALKEAIMHEKDLQLKADQEITAEDPGMPFLKVSYDELEPQLKECLLCLSAFPVNRVIKRRVMIYRWIGEGLVAPTRDGRTAEQVGKDYFKMLIAIGLIEPIYQKHTKTAKYCKIYTWVRQMLVSKAKESEFFEFDPEDRPIFGSGKNKRACLVAEKEKDQVEISPESNTNELVSIFNLNVHYLTCDKGKDQLAKLKTVSALVLGRWQNSSCHHIEVSDTKFLDGLESLEKLMYISLQGISRITELPETIAVLSKLLILDLRLCHNLEKVTLAVTKIKSLTHLDVSECYLLDKMPPGMGSLTNLQVLKGFVVGGTRIKDPCRLSELTKLKRLRKLSIRIGSEADIGEDLGELSKIKKLKSLKITWGSTERKSSRSGTFSHQNLEKLVLECVPGDESVSWLKPDEFKGLKRLYIAGGKLTQLSPVTENHKWNVEILRLKYLKELKFEWDVLKSPRRLRCVQIYKCWENGPSDEKGFWVRNENEASSSSMGGTTDPVRMANEEARSSSMAGTNAPVLMGNEASSSSMAGTSAPVRMRNEAEASSSSLARTTAPVPMRNEGEASSRSMAGTTAPVPMRNEEEASSRSMAGTTAPVPMRNEGEASSSSMAGTTAPFPMRNEREESSSSLAGTGAPVPMRNEGEASSSAMAGISAPVPMRNEGEASSSSMSGTSPPVPMRNEGEASSSSMTGTSAPIRMRNEEEASSSSIAAASASVVQDDLDS